MNRTLVITGASGFLGAELLSALAPRFDRVVSLTGRRGSPSPGGTVDGAPVDVVSSVDELVSSLNGHRPAQVWNCASLLSYGRTHLGESISANTALPLELFERCAPSEGYFHISTVGVADSGPAESVPEALTQSLTTRIPYVVAKTFAEHLLAAKAARSRVPTIIIRTGSLIGNLDNAAEVSNKSGYFSLADGMARAQRRGACLTLDVRPDSRPPLAHTHHVAAFAVHLSETTPVPDRPTIVHALDQDLTVSEMVEAVNDECGSRVWALGEPQVAFDSAFAKANSENIRFMDEDRYFDNAAWGSWRQSQGITSETLRDGFARYMHRHILAASNRTSRPTP